jgi:CheY-like chemotaxis protein/anti-sigma regulatory factor (Ser/Thr protein kinase)
MAMLGHELRNPLSPIVTALQLMRLRGDGTTERERQVIERQVRHLTRLVDDLLDVSRIARGKVDLKVERLDVAEVIAKALETASPLLEERLHTLAVDVPRGRAAVAGDAARLTQVFSNLLTNAAKYTPAGGRIEVRADVRDRDVAIAVRDTGVGIAPDMVAHVFDAFVQGPQPIDRGQGGLGLGLTIVRSLVERHGGTVTAASEGPGRGSEFVVRLPLAAGVATVAEAPSEPVPQATGNGMRVLVVDDNVDAADLLAEALAMSGFTVRVAHDALEAMRIAAEYDPELAILDIGLPVMDGYELALRLRSMPGLERVRLIAVTGYGQPSDRERSAEAGFDHHVVKPVDVTQLTELALAQ